MPAVETSVLDSSTLADNIANLRGEGRVAFDNLFQYRIESKDPFSLRIRDKWTHRQKVYSPNRAARHIDGQDLTDLIKTIEERRGLDPFCTWEKDTPEGEVRRIRGESCVTAHNKRPVTRFHEVLINYEHDPLLTPTLAQFRDQLDVSDIYFQQAHRLAPEAIFRSVGKNTTPESGASMWEHGHSQLYLAADFPLGEVIDESVDVMDFYRRNMHRDYLRDYFVAHEALGQAVEHRGVMFIVSLTPMGKGELLMLTGDLGDEARDTLYQGLYFMSEVQGIKAHNWALAYPPLGSDGRDWDSFPNLARVVDRGRIFPRASRSYGVSPSGMLEAAMGIDVIDNDPIELAQRLWQFLGSPHFNTQLLNTQLPVPTR